jgi:hypothetical protein
VVDYNERKEEANQEDDDVEREKSQEEICLPVMSEIDQFDDDECCN